MIRTAIVLKPRHYSALFPIAGEGQPRIVKKYSSLSKRVQSWSLLFSSDQQRFLFLLADRLLADRLLAGRSFVEQDISQVFRLIWVPGWRRFWLISSGCLISTNPPFAPCFNGQSGLAIGEMDGIRWVTTGD